jgi:hypothetical protein
MKFSKLLASVVIAGTFASGALAKEFKDLDPTHWAYQQIQALSKDETVVGYPDDTFRPDVPVTRAEFATMVVKALGKNRSPINEIFYYSDVPETYWAYKAIQRASNYDLVKGFPDNLFKPEDNISKSESVSIIVSAVNTDTITEAQAKQALKVYTDAASIPEWAVIPAGKSEKLNLTAHNPMTYNLFEADKKVTRGEVAVNLYNMKEEARLNPNSKLAPRKADDGVVLDNVTVDGTIATIPAGTMIPADLLTAMNSQSDEVGKVFATVTNKNIITKEHYLLIPKGSNISGEIIKIKPARYFIRNGKMNLSTKNINYDKYKSSFPGKINTKVPQKKGFARIINLVFRGTKLKMAEGQEVYVKLTKPVVVDLTCSVVLEY